MARIGYGALLLAVAALSFQLGASLGTSVPPVETSPPIDASRFAALERRVEELAGARPATTSVPPQRVLAESSMPANDALESLREAVLTLGRSHPQAMSFAPAPSPTNLAAVQATLASAVNGRIEHSDLLMLTVPQVLQRFGRPTRVPACNHDELVLQFACGAEFLQLNVVGGWVTQVHIHKDS